MGLPANIRLQVPAKVPTRMEGLDGISVYKQNGVWFIRNQNGPGMGGFYDIAAFVTDPTEPAKALVQLTNAMNLAAQNGRPLIYTQEMPDIDIADGTIEFPSGLTFIAFGKPLVIKHTRAIVSGNTNKSDIYIKGMKFYGAHDSAIGNINEYSVRFFDSTNIEAHLEYENGNSGTLFQNCRHVRGSTKALNMVANGGAVRGWNSWDISLDYVHVKNAKGFGFYGTDGACFVRIKSLRKEYDESVMTPYLLSERDLHITKFVSTGSPDNEYTYFLGLEGLGVTTFTHHWLIDEGYIERSSDNGMSTTGSYHRVRNVHFYKNQQDAVHSYGPDNTFMDCIAEYSGSYSSTGFVDNGFGFNASSGAGGCPRNVKFIGCRSYNNIKGDFSFDGGTFTQQWVSGGTRTRGFIYYDDGTWVTMWAVPGGSSTTFGTISPTAAGWTYDESKTQQEQSSWNDGITAFAFRSRVPTGQGPFAFNCTVDGTCVATNSDVGKRWVDSAPSNAGNVFEPLGTGGSGGLSNANGDLTLATNGEARVTFAGANATSRPKLALRRANGTKTSPTDVAVSTILGEIQLWGYLSGAYELMGYLRGIVGGISGSFMRTAWQLFSRAADGSFYESLRVTFTGGVTLSTPTENITATVHSLETALSIAAPVFSYRAEQDVTAAGVIALTSGMVAFKSIGPITITGMSSAERGIFMVNLRNDTANAVTIQHNASSLRLNSGANVVLNQHQSITLRRIADATSVWQQI